MIREWLNKIKHNKGASSDKRNVKKYIVFTVFTVGNLFALTAATYAWFSLATKTSRVSTVSGDLNVSIKKLSAYKYVYPFYPNSTEFIDYGDDEDDNGIVKKYVIEDASIVDTITLDTATFVLGTDTGRDIAIPPATPSSLGPEKIYHDETERWRYYLVGDTTFQGVAGADWHTSFAVPFAERQNVETKRVEVNNIVISAGAEFIFFDANTISGSTCNYFTYGDAVSGAPFKSLDGNRIKCLKSGIYNFSYQKVESTYRLVITASPRSDDSIIGNNILDPTKISIDWRGKADKTIFPDVSDYMSQGIYNQRTTVILEVELAYKNVNDITAGLKVIRDSVESQSIYSLPGKYTNAASNTDIGYSEGGSRFPMLASDFYCYYAVFKSSPFATSSEVWSAMHQKTDKSTDSQSDFNKFMNNEETFQTNIDCTLHPDSGDTSDLDIPGNLDLEAPGATRYCYIAIDYDYEHSQFFLKSQRLGRFYSLKRDIGFRFTGTQKKES